MIPPRINRPVMIGGAQASASFAISEADSAHIMGILREGLYSDKVLAILREYSSNAWDSHRSVGKHELPIKITLPTSADPTLRIRDYGPGLSHHDVFCVYTQYGRSTKRDSDDVVGMLGIGSKSGFAYSDSFTVTSWHDGVRRTYVATLGDDEKGAITLLDETSCELDDTGVEIQIATKTEDRYEFERTARRLFRHMTPRPEINIELPAPPTERTLLTHGAISPGDGEWIAVMGCVPYRVNLDQLDAKQISPALRHMSGQLTFGIGEVQVSASREELKYTSATKIALVEKANALVDEFVTQALQQLESGVIDGWHTRLRVQVLAKLDLPLPDKWRPFAEGFAKVTYHPDDFTIIHNKSACTRLLVSDCTRLLIDDTGNDLSGYTLGHDDYVVRSANKTPVELRAALDAVLVVSGLVGVTIGLLSSEYWNAPAVPVKRKSNPKHRARMFQLVTDPKGKAPWSNNWEPVTRVPTPEDVYVVIEGFKPCKTIDGEDYDEFWSDALTDRKLIEAFGGAMPVVYGYKITEKKPLSTAPEGKPYQEWRTGLAASLLTPERQTLIGAYWRAHPKSGRWEEDRMPTEKERSRLAQQLGEDHLIVAFYLSAVDAAKALDGHNESGIRMLAARNGLTFDKSAAHFAYAALKKRYPLLARAGWKNLWHTGYGEDAAERDEWAEYVQLRDAKDAPARDNLVQLKSVP